MRNHWGDAKNTNDGKTRSVWMMQSRMGHITYGIPCKGLSHCRFTSLVYTSRRQIVVNTMNFCLYNAHLLTLFAEWGNTKSKLAPFAQKSHQTRSNENALIKVHSTPTTITAVNMVKVCETFHSENRMCKCCGYVLFVSNNHWYLGGMANNSIL